MPYIKTAQFKELQRKAAAYDRRQAEIREALRWKSVCDTCGVQSMERTPGQVCPSWDCEGEMVEIE